MKIFIIILLIAVHLTNALALKILVKKRKAKGKPVLGLQIGAAVFTILLTWGVFSQIKVMENDLKLIETREPAFSKIQASPNPVKTIDYKSILKQNLPASDHAKLEKPWLLVNFWATWCTPCVEEIALFNQQMPAFKAKQIELIAFHNEDSIILNAFIQKHPLNYPTYAYKQFKLLEDFKNPSGFMPYNVLLKNGTIVKQKMGALSAQELNDWLLLAK